jgi:flagellar hook-associated protein 2
MATLGPTFQAGGLASGMDTTALVDQLMALEARPVTLMAARQKAYTVQISNLGQLAANLAGLKSAATSLKTDGISVIKANSTYTDFSVSGSADNVGRYTINVDTLASSAKTRLQPFTSATDETLIPDDIIHISLDGGTAVDINTTGRTLNEIASDINSAVSGVTASIVNDGTNYHLSITRKDTGYTGAVPGTALAITVDNPGAWNQGAWVTTNATNAKVFVDGLEISRRTNELTDVISGATLSLKAASGTDTTVVFERDGGSTQANLQRLIDSYNTVAKYLQSHLRAAPGVKPQDEKLSGTAITGLQQQLQGLMANEYNTTGAIRTMGNLGIKLLKDGTLELDGTKLAAAVAADPQAVDKIFTTLSTGLSARVTTIVDRYTNALDGILVNKQKDLQKTIDNLDKRKEAITLRLERRREQMVRQFTAMERLVSNFSSIGQFLENQSAQASKK